MSTRRADCPIPRRPLIAPNGRSVRISPEARSVVDNTHVQRAMRSRGRPGGRRHTSRAASGAPRSPAQIAARSARSREDRSAGRLARTTQSADRRRDVPTDPNDRSAWTCDLELDCAAVVVADRDTCDQTASRIDRRGEDTNLHSRAIAGLRCWPYYTLACLEETAQLNGDPTPVIDGTSRARHRDEPELRWRCYESRHGVEVALVEAGDRLHGCRARSTCAGLRRVGSRPRHRWLGGENRRRGGVSAVAATDKGEEQHSQCVCVAEP